MTVRKTQHQLERLFIGICSVSLSANAWFISNKLDHVYDALKGLNDKLGSVSEDVAATKAEVQMHTASITYLQRLQDRALLHAKDLP